MRPRGSLAEEIERPCASVPTRPPIRDADPSLTSSVMSQEAEMTDSVVSRSVYDRIALTGFRFSVAACGVFVVGALLGAAMNFAPSWQLRDLRWIIGWGGIAVATVLAIVALVLSIHAIIHWAGLRRDGRIYAVVGVILAGIVIALWPVLFSLAAGLINFPDYSP